MAFLITGMTFATTPTNFIETQTLVTSNDFKFSEFEVVDNSDVFDWEKVELRNSNEEDDWDNQNDDIFAMCGGECINTEFGATDGGRDGCDWYIDREDECGNHDNSNFIASLQCCVCGGGVQPDECEDSNYLYDDVTESDLWDNTYDRVDLFDG